MLFDNRPMGPRTVGLLCRILLQTSKLEAIDMKTWAIIFGKLDTGTFEALPKVFTRIRGKMEDGICLGSLRAASYFGMEISEEKLSKWLGDLKGFPEGLSDYISAWALCKFNRDDQSLKAAFERMILRNASTASFILGELEMVPLVLDSFLLMLSNESDVTRQAALDAFKKSRFSLEKMSDLTERLVKLFNSTVINLLCLYILTKCSQRT